MKINLYLPKEIHLAVLRLWKEVIARRNSPESCPCTVKIYVCGRINLLPVIFYFPSALNLFYLYLVMEILDGFGLFLGHLKELVIKFV